MDGGLAFLKVVVLFRAVGFARQDYMRLETQQMGNAFLRVTAASAGARAGLFGTLCV